jgi:hypothetical protein
VWRPEFVRACLKTDFDAIDLQRRTSPKSPKTKREQIDAAFGGRGVLREKAGRSLRLAGNTIIKTFVMVCEGRPPTTSSTVAKSWVVRLREP